METAILLEDADGKDPLPKYLQSAVVSFSRGGLTPEKDREINVNDEEVQDVNSKLLRDKVEEIQPVSPYDKTSGTSSPQIKENLPA